MKTKTDFVTNSSSVSFVVMGCYIDPNTISEEVIERLVKTINVKRPYDRPVTLESVREDIYESLDFLFEGTDLAYSSGQWGDGDLAIGIPYDHMEVNETLNQFKERVKDQIKKSTGRDVAPDHIEMCWMDN